MEETAEFEKGVMGQINQMLNGAEPLAKSDIQLNDSRCTEVKNETVDATNLEKYQKSPKNHHFKITSLKAL